MTAAERTRLADSLATLAVSAATQVVEARLAGQLTPELVIAGAVERIAAGLRLRGSELVLEVAGAEPLVLGRIPTLAEAWSATEPASRAGLAEDLVGASAGMQVVATRLAELGTRDELATRTLELLASSLQLRGSELVLEVAGAEPRVLGRIPTLAAAWRKTHDAASAYQAGELVMHRGSAWLATADHDAGAEIPGAGWELFAQRGHNGRQGRCDCLACGGSR